MEGAGILIKVFYYDDSPVNPPYGMIRVDVEKIPHGKMEGSWNILPARLMGINYADYLRFCRDVLDAKVIGKNTKYPVPYFKQSKETTQFIRLLNKRVELLFWEKEHPDFWDKVSEKEFEEEYVSVWERTLRK